MLIRPTRRMRSRTLLLVLLATAALLAGACGSDGDDAGGDEGSGSSATAEQQHIDTLRISYDLAGPRRGGFFLDPQKTTSVVGDLGVYHWIYGGLMRPDESGILVPDLAESAEIVDPNTIEVTLRGGLTFPDGTALDATAAKAALDRNLATSSLPAYNPNFYKVAGGITVVDDTTLRIAVPDGTAAGWADSFLGSQETLIIQEGVDFDQPEGAGPYEVVSYQPGATMVLEKNPDYWDADAIHVDRIEIVNAADAQSGVLALSAGQVDWASKLEIPLIGGLGSQFTVTTTPIPDFLVQLAMCKSEAPFDDPDVRRALSTAIDREAINEAVFDGKGEVAQDLWPADHPLHHDEITDVPGYDPEGAKQLLTDAGYPDGFTFDLAQQLAGGSVEMSQILQQQFAAIGVTMNLVPVQNYQQEFLRDKKMPVGISPNVPGRTTARLASFSGRAISNVCSYTDPQIDALAAELQRTATDAPEYAEIWADLQQRVIDESVSIFVLFRPVVTAFDSEVLQELPPASYNITIPEIRAI
jgi:peptide/nickel transport system substrate-binding protein